MSIYIYICIHTDPHLPFPFYSTMAPPRATALDIDIDIDIDICIYLSICIYIYTDPRRPSRSLVRWHRFKQRLCGELTQGRHRRPRRHRQLRQPAPPSRRLLFSPARIHADKLGKVAPPN